MVSINDLTVAWGGFTLLDNISFHISESDKIGLVGKNGAGKSTLMKLIIGQQNPTSGVIDRPPGLTIGYLPQIMEHHHGLSVMEETMTVFSETSDIEREIESLTALLAERTDYESDAYVYKFNIYILRTSLSLSIINRRILYINCVCRYFSSLCNTYWFVGYCIILSQNNLKNISIRFYS